MSETPTMQVLSEAECWERLRTTELGRLAYHLAEEVHIAPVNYAVDGTRILFRTAEGSKLLGVVMNEDVAFEIDRVDDEEEQAWSVVARGRASLVEGQEARDADNLRLRTWVGAGGANVVAIHVSQVSGRHFSLVRPWRHPPVTPPAGSALPR